MKKIQLFDVDGTLTYSERDIVTQSPHKVFSFWPILSFALARDPKELAQAIANWEEQLKTHPDPDQSSFDFMAQTVSDYLRPNFTQTDIIEYAKEVTHHFLDAGIVRLNAIEYLRDCLEQDILCVLTTGSYLDGLIGFVQVLQEKQLLPISDNLVLNGAIIDWPRKILTWPNVGAYKTRKVQETLKQLKIDHYQIQAAFGDDPYVNDAGILAMADQGFVIKCHKNATRPFSPAFIHCSWEEYLEKHKII